MVKVIQNFLIGSIVILCMWIKPGLLLAQADSIGEGVTWLLSVQHPDGSWSQDPRVYLDTYTALETLLLSDVQDAGTSLALSWLRDQFFTNTDDLARKVLLLSLAGEGVSADLFTLLTSQAPDSGWGADQDFSSDIFDTTLALQALSTDSTANATAISGAVNYLLAAQNTDGGWGLVVGDISNVFVTALVMQALETQPQTTAIANALSMATTFLLAHQNADGGFGSSPSTVWETALAFLAISKTTGDVTARTSAINYLLTQQQTDGSWNQDPYSTALALQALHASLSQTPPPPPPTTGTLTGTVKDGSTQAPLQDVLVEIVALGLSSTTDASGGFSLSNIEAGTVQLTFSKAGYSTGTLSTDVPAGSVKDLGTLLMTANPNTGIITGTVTDADTGNALAGVTINITGPASMSTLTAADGTYTITDVPTGSYTLTASKTGYDPVIATGNVVAGGTLIFSPALTPSPTTGTITGKVTDAGTGAPLQGATINLSGTTTASTATGPDGTYSLTAIPAGTITLTAQATGYDPVTVTGEMLAGAMLIFSPALVSTGTTPPTTTGTIRGTVTDAQSGLPLNQVTVGISGPVSLSTLTGPEGTYQFLDLLDGSYIITVSKAGYQTATGTGFVTAGAILVFDAALSPVPTTGTLTGTVVDADTAMPISTATVTIVELGLSSGTDLAGDFSFVDIPGGTYTFSIAAPDYLTQTGTLILPGGASVDLGIIRLSAKPSTTSVSGVVSDDSTGLPIPNAIVILLDTGTPVTADSNGMYSIGNIELSIFTLKASAPGYLGRVRNLFLTEPQSIQSDFSLTPTALSDLVITEMTPDAPSYPAQATARITVTAENQGTQTIEGTLILRVQDETGVVVDIKTLAGVEVIPFSPGVPETRTLSWLTQQSPPGIYHLTVELHKVVDGGIGEILAEQTLSMEVLPTQLISGVLLPTPPVVQFGSQQSVQWVGELRNAGNIPLVASVVILNVTRQGETTPSFTGQQAVPELVIGQFIPVDFGSWLPQAGGVYEVTGAASDPAIGVDLQYTYYVGPGVRPTFTVNPSIVQASTASQTVSATLRLDLLDPPVASAPQVGTSTIGLWHLNGDAVDATGNHPGMIVGADCSVAGQFGPGCEFSGAQYISIANHPDLSPAAISVEAWVYSSNWSAQTNPILVGKATSGAYRLFKSDQSGFNEKLAFQVGAATAYGTTTVQNNTWYHLVGTYDGKAIKLYVNGVLEGTGCHTGGYTINTRELGIGAAMDSTGAWKNFFQGRVDEVALYNRALDPVTIATHAGANTGVVELDLAVVSPADLSYSGFSQNPSKSMVQSDGTMRHEWPSLLVGSSGFTLTWDVTVPPLWVGEARSVATAGEITLINAFEPRRLIVPFATGFRVPGGLAFDAAGNLYVANGWATTGNLNTISKVSPSGVVSTFASGFNNPTDLAFDSLGNLYVTNRFPLGTGNASISKVTPAGVKSTFATGLTTPTGIAMGPDGNLYVGERDLGRITRITPQGVKSTFAQLPVKSDSLLSLAIGLDSEAFLYAAVNQIPVSKPWTTVYRVSQDGQVSVFATGFSHPQGMTVLPGENLLVVNRDTCSVIQLSPDAQVRNNYIESLTSPNMIVMDSSGNAYVSESVVNDVVKIIPNPAAVPVTVPFDPPSITASGLLSLTASTDQSSYPANTPVVITASITNGSLIARDLTVRVTIEDANGNTVTTLPDQFVSQLASGASATTTATWNTDTTLAGGYQARVQAIEGGIVVAEAIAPFTIEAGLGLSTSVTTDKIQYSANETVTLALSVTSNSTNATLTRVSATVTITDATAASVFSESRALPDFLPGGTFSFKSFWNTNTTAAGEYTAQLTVTTDQGLISTSTTSFTIVSSLEQAKALAGTITVSPNTIIEGETTQLAYTVQNIGNEIDVPQVTLEILVVDPQTGQVLRTLTDFASLNAREVFSNGFAFDSTGLLPLPHLFILRGVIGEVVQTLASTALVINPLPNTAPTANAGPDQVGVIGQPVTLDGTGSFDPDGDPLIYTWAFVSVPEGSALTDADLTGTGTATPSFVPDVVGTYTLSLVVNDGLLSSQTDLVSVHVSPPLSFDLHPETINLKSKGGSTSVTGVLFSPLLSGFASLTGPDGVTVTASFSLTHTYTDKNGNPVTFTTPVTDYSGDDFMMAVDLDGDGVVDGYQITLKLDRALVIKGFTDEAGQLRITQPTELTSTVLGNGIPIGSDVNTVISPSEVTKGGK